jgi:hypothetical protein
MADESTPEDVARFAAALRWYSQAKQAEAEAPEPGPEQDMEPEPTTDSEAQEFVQRLFAPKPQDELIRRLHPEEE